MLLRLPLNIQADTPTARGVLYPADVLQKAVGDLQSVILEGRALGVLELKTPFEKVSTETAAFRVTDFSSTLTQKEYAGVLEITDVPEGKRLQGAIDRIGAEHFRLAMLGTGIISENAEHIRVVSDLIITGFSIITDNGQNLSDS